VIGVRVALWLGALVTIPVAVYCWQLASYQFYPAAFSSSLAAGYLVMIATWTIPAYYAAQVDFGAAYTLWITNVMLGGLYGFAWQIILEYHVIDDVDRVELLPERWPAWFQRGLLGEVAE